MQSTKIIAYRKDKIFGIPIVCENGTFAIKFDTGASETVVSLEKLFPNVTFIQRHKLKRYVKKHNIESQLFKTANGSTFRGVLTYMNNVKIGQYTFEKFYYYLVIDKTGKQIALLGDDFIDCCDFCHKAHNDIIITSFDFAAYNNRTNSMSMNEVCEVLQ